MKHTPATPLPWVSRGLSINSRGCRTERGTPTGEVIVADMFRHGFDDGAANAAFAAHAASAYPKLVEALREIANYTPPSTVQPALIARALLRELGEDE